MGKPENMDSKPIEALVAVSQPVDESIAFTAGNDLVEIDCVVVFARMAVWTRMRSDGGF